MVKENRNTYEWQYSNIPIDVLKKILLAESSAIISAEAYGNKKELSFKIVL